MGTLSFENGKYRFTGDNLSVAKHAGFQWNAISLQWETRHPRKALGLRRWADESAERKLKRSFITELPPPECVVFPDHLTPRLFQVESAWHCLSRTPAYCADQQGIGKTITAILCLNSIPGKALIVCPPYLKYNWEAELKVWRADPAAKIAIIEDGKTLSSNDTWKADIVILPDSMLSRSLTQAMVAEHRWRWLIVDEAQRYKEATTQRTMALVGSKYVKQPIIDACERTVFLSGTPIPNGRPVELWPLLSELCHEALGHRSFEEFGKTFCAGKLVTRFEGKRPIRNWDFTGASNLSLLRKELRAKLMIRHLKKDVLKELGPKTRKIVFLDDVSRLKPLEQSVLNDFTLEELMGEETINLGDVATYRREVGEAKLDAASEYAADLLESSGDKLVVFAHHITVVEGLKQKLARFHPLCVRGGMKAKEKHQCATLFQTKSKHRVIIGNMDAMGTGLTLTKAPGVIVVEPSWVPGVNEQAEDRVHRMTQDQNVYVRYLVLRNSLDERMLTRVLAKQKAISKVMD